MIRMMRVPPRLRALLLLLVLFAAACTKATPPDTRVLEADLQHEDIPPETLKTLIGIIEKKHEVKFPDGEGTVEVIVSYGRAADLSSGQPRVPGADARLYLRTINVLVVDAAGYELGASLLGVATNVGTEAAPIHARMVQIRRHKAGLTGSKSATMSVRVTPETLEVL